MHLPQVMDDQNSQLIRPITVKEMLLTIQKSRIRAKDTMDTQMSFIKFLKILSPTLCKLFNWILEKEVWPHTCNYSISYVYCNHSQWTIENNPIFMKFRSN